MYFVAFGSATDPAAATQVSPEKSHSLLSRLGAPEAIAAMARKLARPVYRMMKYG